MRTKKELLEVVLVVMLGVIFILLMALNVQIIDNQTSTQINQVESMSNDL